MKIPHVHTETNGVNDLIFKKAAVLFIQYMLDRTVCNILLEDAANNKCGYISGVWFYGFFCWIVCFFSSEKYDLIIF